jgi:3-deoxy-D-manno-octulosonate 8-phosphate phosphatase (KDO 8-P phosphatase)
MMPYPENLLKKAASIALVITDVDGVLTNGQIYYNNQGETITGFHIQDGLGIRLLLKNHIPVGILTGRKNPAVMHRMRELGVEHVYQGLSDKIPAYETLLKTLKLSDAEVAYIGDDIPDLPVLQRVGLSVSPADGNGQITQITDWVTQSKGGQGAFRELADLIFKAKNINVLV